MKKLTFLLASAAIVLAAASCEKIAKKDYLDVTFTHHVDADDGTVQSLLTNTIDEMTAGIGKVTNRKDIACYTDKNGQHIRENLAAIFRTQRLLETVAAESPEKMNIRYSVVMDFEGAAFPIVNKFCSALPAEIENSNYTFALKATKLVEFAGPINFNSSSSSLTIYPALIHPVEGLVSGSGLSIAVLGNTDNTVASAGSENDGSVTIKAMDQGITRIVLGVAKDGNILMSKTFTVNSTYGRLFVRTSELTSDYELMSCTVSSDQSGAKYVFKAKPGLELSIKIPAAYVNNCIKAHSSEGFEITVGGVSTEMDPGDFVVTCCPNIDGKYTYLKIYSISTNLSYLGLLGEL